jgi:hypothetical protein
MPSLLPVLLRLALVPAALAPGGVPFEKAARDFMAQHGLADKKAEEVEFETVLKGHFVRGQFGAFEVCFPVAALDRRAADLRDCAAALLLAQEKLADWSKASGRDQKALRADLKTVSDWVKSWRVPALAKAKDSAGKDLAAVMAASDTVAAASQRLAASLGKGEALGLARESPVSIRMVLLPTRREFVELACFVGMTNADDKAKYWVDGVADWATCWVQDIQVIALEYAAPNHQPDDYWSGESMNERDPTVMQQQVVQFSVQRLFEQLIGERVPASFLGGMSMNLVIDQFGEISTRVDGDMRGRSAAARSVFVPGVRSDGFLAKNSAETRWREDRGRDRFLHVLRQSQKEGEGLDKPYKNRVAMFGVRSDAGGELSPVHAPFLLPESADTKPPAAAFQGDYAELQRAYKCAFVSWLSSKSAAAEKTSREKWAQFLERIGDPQQPAESVYAAVYEGAPLSDAEAGKDSLEGKFLIWLSKQK